MSSSGIFAKVYREIISGKGSLPSLPAIAIRLRDAMATDSYDLTSIVKIIQTDVAVSAHLMQIANSPLYRSRVPVEDIKSAVRRFGMETTRNIVTSFALRGLFKTDSKALKMAMNRRWQQSAKVAAISSVLAKRCPGFDPDHALLAGLLQDIGVLPLLNELAHQPERIFDEVELEVLLNEYGTKVGVVLLQKWGFDDSYIQVVRSKEDWGRNPGPELDLADIVLIARLFSYIGTQAIEKWPQRDEVPAFRKIPPGDLSADEALKILLAAQQDIAEVGRLLNS